MSDFGKFEAFAGMIASGRTVRSAASELGISERSAYRNAKRPEFKARVSQIRAEITGSVVGQLSSAASKAVSVMVELLDADFEPPLRLQAARAILQALGPVSELSEIRSRLEQLEKQETVK